MKDKTAKKAEDNEACEKIPLVINEDLLKTLKSNCRKTVLITGTNGKTTTNNIANHIFSHDSSVISNLTEVNMIDDVVTPLLSISDRKYDWGIFEIEEWMMPILSEEITPDYVIVTNFFRNHLDKYGEEETTIKLVHNSVKPETTLILNADDPSMLYFDDLDNDKIYYSQEFSKLSKGDSNVADLIFCPKCGKKLQYEYVNYGNIGKYRCPNCGAHNPEAQYTITGIEINDDNTYEFEVDKCERIKLNIPGSYNLYNALGTISLARNENVDYDTIKEGIENFKNEKGRMEEFEIDGEKVVLSLSKNPISLSEDFRTVIFDGARKSILLILNDYDLDGKDISWIWDADFSEVDEMPHIEHIYCAGTRAEEIAVRLKYEDFDLDKLKIYPSQNKNNIRDAIEDMLKESENRDKYIIGSSTAIPEARKILVSKMGDE